MAAGRDGKFGPDNKDVKYTPDALDTQQLRAIKGNESSRVASLFVADDEEVTDPSIIEGLNVKAKAIFDDIVNRLTHGREDADRELLLNTFGDELKGFAKDRALIESRAERKGAIDEKTGFLRDDSYASRLFDLEKRLMVRDSERDRALMLVRIDFDDFKGVNDVYGHDAGDKMLVEFAKKVKDSLRGRDTTGFTQQSMHGLPGRPGGDEFYLVFNSIDLHAERSSRVQVPITDVLLERISQIASEVKRPDGKPLTLSMGYRLIDRNNVSATGDFATELANADRAQMVAKIRGGNKAVEFTPGLELPPLPPEIARQRIIRSVARAFGLAPDVFEERMSEEQITNFVNAALEAANMK